MVQLLSLAGCAPQDRCPLVEFAHHATACAVTQPAPSFSFRRALCVQEVLLAGLAAMEEAEVRLAHTRVWAMNEPGLVASADWACVSVEGEGMGGIGEGGVMSVAWLSDCPYTGALTLTDDTGVCP